MCVAPEIDCFGVCLNPTADPNNCGTCGNTCAADEMCSNRQCVCATGLTRCPDGVCRDLMNDALNCGTCGNACRGNKVCVGGVCQ